MSYNPTSCPAQLRQYRCKWLNRPQRSATMSSIMQAVARATPLRARTRNSTQGQERFLSPRARNRGLCDLAYRVPRNFLPPKTDNQGCADTPCPELHYQIRRRYKVRHLVSTSRVIEMRSRATYALAITSRKYGALTARPARRTRGATRRSTGRSENMASDRTSPQVRPEF